MIINPTQGAKMQQQMAAIQPNQEVPKTEKAENTEKTEAAELVKSEVSDKKVDTSKQNYKMDSAKVAELKMQFSQQSASFQAMIRKMFADQGVVGFQAEGGNLRDLFEQLTVDPATQAKAKEAIAEDGDWGVKKTSARILEFAKALSGGDPAKIDILKNAFEKGYQAAAGDFGKLPDICKQTYDAVMKGFDEWANEGKTPEADAPVDKAAEKATVEK